MSKQTFSMAILTKPGYCQHKGRLTDQEEAGKAYISSDNAMSHVGALISLAFPDDTITDPHRTTQDFKLMNSCSGCSAFPSFWEQVRCCTVSFLLKSLIKQLATGPAIYMPVLWDYSDFCTFHKFWFNWLWLSSAIPSLLLLSSP